MKPSVKNFPEFLCTLVAGLCLSMHAYAAASSPPLDSEFTITPEVMTGTTKSSSTSNASTLGIEYSLKKSYGLSTPVPCGGDGCDTISWFKGSVSATGKVAADSNINVGNMINFSGTAGYEIKKLDSVIGNDKSTGRGNIDAKAGYEESQDHSTSNYTYGLSAYGYYSPSNATTWINYPAAVLEFERINPSTDTARKAVDPALSNYNRGHIKLSAGLKFSNVVQGRDLKLDFKLDNWREINPSSAIVAANLDRQTFRATSIMFPGTGKDPDWLITYASGKVPTGQTSAKVWQLGWNWKFN